MKTSGKRPPGESLVVSHFANSFIGKPGNIGVRTGRVIDALSRMGASGYCLSRGALTHARGFRYRDMGWLGQVPRLLNALRIYALPAFNHRYLDIKLFEGYARLHLGEVLEGRPQVVHVWDTCPSLLHALKAEGMTVLLDMPIAPTAYSRRISQEGGLDFLMTQQSLIRFEAESFALADLILAPSAFVAEELGHCGVPPRKIRVVEFGSDLPARNHVDASKPSAKAGGLDFCFVGNVNRRKGLDVLLDAWNSPEFRHDRLHLCGRVFPEVRSLIDRAQGGGIIVTPGFVNPFTYFVRCDVFVFPSWLEGSAKAVYEAMACGLPAIVTRSAGSVVRDGLDGFVIEPGDSTALRDRLLWFKANQDQIGSMGASARQRAAEFSWDRYTQRVLDIYREQPRCA